MPQKEDEMNKICRYRDIEKIGSLQQVEKGGEGYGGKRVKEREKGTHTERERARERGRERERKRGRIVTKVGDLDIVKKQKVQT